MGTTKTSPALGRHWGAFGFALVALTPLSCSFVFDADTEQCNTDLDCSKREFAGAICVAGTCQRAPTPPVDPVWGCLEGPPLVTSREVFVDVQLEVVDAVTRSPRTDATVNVCSRLDGDCERPIVPSAPIDTSGKVTFRVAQDFDGFLEVYGPKGRNEADPAFVRMLVFLPPREIVRGAANRGVLIFDQARMSSLSALGSPRSDPFTTMTGLIVMTALTCEGGLAGGVSYELKTPNATPNTQPFYTVNRIPLLSVTETDASGTGGFTSVQQRLVQLGATLNSQQRSITPDVGVGAYVRAGWYTQVYVAP